MEIDIDETIQEVQLEMEASLEHLQGELLKIRTGKASPAMLSGVLVDYYGAPTPINQVANLSTSDSRTINIQPWEKPMIPKIEQAIFKSNLGLTPQNNGEMVIINVPALTEERRKVLVKQARSLGEDAKISLRSARHKGMDTIKKAVKDGYPEDAGKRSEETIQKMTDKFSDQVEAIINKKEEEIMTV